VESVAENTVDGVTSPLFYAMLAGVPGAIAFKAISTLDSIFGYKNERYLQFGWASAGLDDAANYVPARVTVPFVVAAAGVLGYGPGDVVATVRRDGRKHSSPNSAVAKAAFAGALGVRLGGPLHSHGQLVLAPFIGTPKNPLRGRCILEAITVMYVALLLMVGFLTLLTVVGGAVSKERSRKARKSAIPNRRDVAG
jgi:adenosylcobinamide-phosphate synthase